MLSLILRENVQTNYVNYGNQKFCKSKILRSSGIPKDSDAFFECSNAQFFSYSFYILGFKKLFEKLSQTRIWHLLESVLPAVSTHVWSAEDQFDICKSLP